MISTSTQTLNSLVAKNKQLNKEMEEGAKAMRIAERAVMMMKKKEKEAAAAVAPPFTSKQEAQKAILDTELELISQQNQGGDITHLQQKVQELRREVVSLGLIQSRGGAAASGAPTRGRGYHQQRNYRVGVRSIDKRPKEILVSGFELG